ncbi:zinc finger protein 260-like [Anoplophora glabripennis]|uniref:zinc finger protein 260-like n=1 Tax=Anoplophora glabripennis TaxID=217634 RepID=UPI0008742D3D|nr:zinc finger protein 260-like [Anoplophora glabripennis]
MNDKLYTENYASYKPRQGLKQAANEATWYSCSNFSSNSSNTSQATNFMDASFQNYSCQRSSHRSVFVQQEQRDVLVWEDRIISDVEKAFKSDKAIEVFNKDLIPVTYCNNVDLITSDLCKQNANKDMRSFNKFGNEWYYGQDNCSEKSSCARETHRNQSIDYVTGNCSYDAMFHENCNLHCRILNRNVANEAIPDYYNYYDNKHVENQSFTQNIHCFNTSTTSLINPIDQQTEGSNEDSDIVVEDSDEEIVEYSEYLEKQSYPTNKCLICNIAYKPLGTQFYFLKEKNPLTMSTQRPVIQKLANVIGEITTTRNYLCSECLGNINNIDHLELKLEKLKSDVIVKFKRNCMENKIQDGKRSCTRTSRINKWPKYKCKSCNKILCLRKYCLYHIKRHRSGGYLCDSCGRIYSSKMMFSLHRRRHKKKLCTSGFSFDCSNCDKTFRTRSNQKEHENYCMNILPFECKQHDCDKKFPSATKLKNHVRLKHDKKFTVICSICNIGFIKLSDYKSHMISHSAEKKYPCPKCDRNYKTLSNLNFHMKIHRNSLPFSCQTCKKEFMRKEYLEAHTNNHKGIKNFACTKCEKKFVSQKNLDAHLKYHDGTVKKSICNICGKTMTSGFEEHLRIHNNLKEFECGDCDTKFNTKGALSKHVKKKHK